MPGKTYPTLRALLTIAAWLAGAYILHIFEYFQAFGQIDNPGGMLPPALLLAGLGCLSALLWLNYRGKTRLAAALGLLTVLLAAMFPMALRKDWPNVRPLDIADERPDVSRYSPFSPNSQLARLEQASLSLEGDLPALDGATALYPVYAAFAEATYDEKDFLPGTVLCTSTRQAYKALIGGQRDIIFVAAPSEEQRLAARATGADLRFTAIGREAFVLVAGRDNPLKSLSQQEIRNIFSGKTAHWSTLGWPMGGRILTLMRPEGSGSQTGLKTFMGGVPIQAPQPLSKAEASLITSNSVIRQISMRRGGIQPALGYSYRYYVTGMNPNREAKILHVDGVEPSIENIQSGKYPFTGNFYAVTRGEPQGNSKLLIDWILSPEGQELIEKTGYVPV